MHETRNFLMVLLLIAGLVWSFFAWLVFNPAEMAAPIFQRATSLLLLITMAAWLFYALRVEDKLPNHLRDVVGGLYYYEADGVSFMPTVRKNHEQAELYVYYQNRFENPVQVIVHLRPAEESFVIHPGMRDVHFAFKAGGGDFGVLHQPIAIPEHVQGQVVEVQLAANSFYPRSQGACLRKRAGMPCGSLHVDWSGSAFKSGVHEVSGEVELLNPVRLHLSMPAGVVADTAPEETWRQECLTAGVTS